MRICVYGAGSIGGNFATRLAAAGNEVSVVVRGAHLEAIRANGLTLLTGDKKIVMPEGERQVGRSRAAGCGAGDDEVFGPTRAARHDRSAAA